VLRRMRYPSDKVSMGVCFWGLITKVINVGNLRRLTMLKRSMLLKKMCSGVRSCGTFNRAVEETPALCNMYGGSGFLAMLCPHRLWSVAVFPYLNNSAELRRINAWKFVF
jgi:hypothetical protein